MQTGAQADKKAACGEGRGFFHDRACLSLRRPWDLYRREAETEADLYPIDRWEPVHQAALYPPFPGTGSGGDPGADRCQGEAASGPGPGDRAFHGDAGHAGDGRGPSVWRGIRAAAEPALRLAQGADQPLSPQPTGKSRKEKVPGPKAPDGGAAPQLYQPGIEPFFPGRKAQARLSAQTPKGRLQRPGQADRSYRHHMAERLHPQPAEAKMPGTGSGVCGGIWKGYQQCMQPVRRVRKEAGGAVLLPCVRV